MYIFVKCIFYFGKNEIKIVKNQDLYRKKDDLFINLKDFILYNRYICKMYILKDIK